MNSEFLPGLASELAEGNRNNEKVSSSIGSDESLTR